MDPFPKFRKKHGPPEDCRAVPSERLSAYESRLPSALLELWKTDGWCSYAKGLIWMTDPEELKDILELWLDKAENRSIFGRTAFGDLFVWDGRETQYLDVQHGTLTSFGGMVTVFFEVSLCSDRFLDATLWRKLYRKALPRLGRPAFDECYALEPALALGGSIEEKNLAKVKLREHVAILAEVVRE